jgi:hypothetical protein
VTLTLPKPYARQDCFSDSSPAQPNVRLHHTASPLAATDLEALDDLSVMPNPA